MYVFCDITLLRFLSLLCTLLSMIIQIKIQGSKSYTAKKVKKIIAVHRVIVRKLTLFVVGVNTLTLIV